MIKFGDKIIADANFITDGCICASKSSDFFQKTKPFGSRMMNF